MKMDGTNEWEIRAMEITKEGDVVMVSGKGTGQQNNFIGELTYMTNSPRLSWLNNIKARVEGSTDMKNNEAILKVWPEQQAPVPAPEKTGNCRTANASANNANDVVWLAL
jgi:hypothetical protein